MNYSVRQKIGLFCGIPVFLFILLYPSPSGLTIEAHRTFAVAFLMAFWWVTEAIPIPATALIPLAAFPMLGISTSKKVASAYGHHFVFLFMGGFFVAMAMQKWGLHKRIALHIIRFIGVSPRRIILGFMCATAFLSMWISNTATTMMMFPIAMAVSSHITDIDKKYDDDNRSNLITALMLGVAYAASIGGIGTLIGTPPNIVFAGAVKSLFPEADEIGYFQWMLIGVPLVIIFLPTVWYYLTYIVCPVSGKEVAGGAELISSQIKELGKMSKGEKYVLVISVMTAMGWILRRDIDLGVVVIPGWSGIMGVEKYVHDSTVAIAAAIVLFCMPVDIKNWKFLLDWEWAKKIPWGILILFGGGIALANGFKESGLAEWIGKGLTGISGAPTLVMIIVTSLLLTFLTEVTSNTATAVIFMPILASAAGAIKVHPYLLMIPATISASCAFMLPVATPPNAIVFSSGYIPASKMAKVGFGLNIIGVIIVTIVVYVIAVPVFNIGLFR